MTFYPISMGNNGKITDEVRDYFSQVVLCLDIIIFRNMLRLEYAFPRIL